MKALFFAGLFFVPFAMAETPLIKRAADGWKAWDKKEVPAEGWTGLEFDDSEWKDATMPVGYGTVEVKTKLHYGWDEKKKHATACVRRIFEVKEAAAAYVIKARIDDGAVFYVNGKEIQRVNIAKEVKVGEYSKTLLGPGVLKHYSTLILEPELVKVGKNVIAVAVHQGSPTSSDLYLDLEISAVNEEEFAALKKEAEERNKKFEAEMKRRKEEEAKKQAPTV